MRKGILIFSAILILSACLADRDINQNQSVGDTETILDEGVSDFGGTNQLKYDEHKLVVMTFNVMCSFCSNDKGDNEKWEDRVPHFGDIISRYNPDLIGLQELTYLSEIRDIQNVIKGYRPVFARDLPKNSIGWTVYPDAIILYREDRFELVESGVYWLSPTPDKPWSYGWADSNIWRIVVWAHLRQISDKRDLYFASTHFDNNYPNEEKSAPVVIERTRDWAKKMPVVVVGDFNSVRGTPAYKILTQEGVETDFRLNNSFESCARWAIVSNQFKEVSYNPKDCYDHIFISGMASWGCNWWYVDKSVYGPNSVYPSDHFPVIAELIW